MFPLSGAPATRICRLMGWEHNGDPYYWTLIEHFETLNAIERHGDAYPWSTLRARERWMKWLIAEERSREPLVVVCLGRKAETALGLTPRAWGEWFEVGLLQAVTIPHTSGRSRVWNDPETESMVKRVLTEAIERAR